jgi:hypothetical protein
MGYLSFTPEIGESYSAVVNENVAAKRFDLPKVLTEGITLTADNINVSKTFVKLERGEKNKDRFNNLLLVAQQNYEVVYMARINFDEGQDAVAINKKNLRAGIMQITVFTNDGIPIASRSVFISNHAEPVLTASAVNTNKRSRSSVRVDLSAYNDPDLAVSVVNAEADTSQADQNILSALLLSSDIKGHIYQPSWYFKDKSNNTLQQLDILMMVHGWSRFNWPEVMAFQYSPLRYPFETGLSVTGKVTQVNGKSVLKSGKINLIIKGEDSTTILSEAAVSAHSGFVVSDLDFKKEATVYYQGTNQNNDKGLVTVTMNTAYIDSLRRTPLTSGYSPENSLATLPPYLKNRLAKKATEDDARSKLVEEVVV